MIEFLRKMIDSGNKGTISIVGDLLIDEYYLVSVDRISPEFPIIIYNSPNDTPDTIVLGGAGNLACQIHNSFGINVDFFGFVDEYGKSLLEKGEIFSHSCQILPENASVPIKRRIYNKSHPLCRWDIERPYYGMNDWQLSELQSKLFSSVQPNSVILYSDYAKGVFAKAQKVTFPDNCISIVDPKKGPLEKWKGCTIFKPNAKEAYELTGEVDWLQQSRKIQKTLGCVAVVITQSDEGVVGLVGGREFEFRPEKKIKAESVVGAGDTFMAWLAASQLYGMDILKGIEIAWAAGSLYVQRKYNRPVNPLELLRYVDPIEGKIIPVKWLEKRNTRLTMANGCFDLLHAGHLHLLQYAKSLGNPLVVAVNSDASVKRLKGENRPVVPLEQRMKLLAGMDCVDFVVSFEENTPLDLVKQLKPNFIVKGEEYKPEDVVGHEWVDEVKICPKLGDISTTNILRNVRS